MIVDGNIAEHAFRQYVASMGQYARHPHPQNTTLFEERKRAFFATTWFPTLAPVEGKHLHHSESLTDNARFFEKFFWSPRGLTLCAMVLDAARCASDIPALAERETRQRTRLLERLHEYGVSSDDWREALRHYHLHQKSACVREWEGFNWKFLEQDEWRRLAEQQSPLAPAYAVMRLLEETNWDWSYPGLLEQLAEVSFDPSNRLRVEAFVRDHYPYGDGTKEAVTMVWAIVSNYLRTGGDSQDSIAWEVLNQQDDLQIVWLVHGLFARGAMSILGGAPKAGKSNLLRALLYSVSTGAPWLEHVVPLPVKAVYYCLEDPQAVFKNAVQKLYSRAGALPVHPDADFTVRFTLDPSRIIPTMQRDVEAGAQVIIVDTLFKALSIQDANSYAEMSVQLDTFSRFAKQHQVHLLLAHHTNKASGERGSSMGMLGSVAIPGATECNIVLSRDEQTGERHINSDNRIPDFLGGSTFKGERVNFDQETGYVWLSRPETKEEKKMVKEMGILSRIATLLWDHPEGLSKNDIEKAIKGYDVKLLREQLQKGHDLGLFAESEKTGKGGAFPHLIHPDFHWMKENFKEAYERLVGEPFPTDDE